MDLLPICRDGVSGYDQVERLIGKWQRSAFLSFVNLHPAGAKKFAGALRIRRPGFGYAHSVRQ